VGLAVVAGAFFVPQVWRAFQAQVQGTDAVALTYGWASTVEHLCNLWLIALFAAFRQPGSTLLAVIVAVCFLYLGVAAISVPGSPGSWGLAGGAIAILGGVGYLAATANARRRASPPASG
jgi:peptidoglycan/LPS O-acetylase OafA/YrhL